MKTTVTKPSTLLQFLKEQYPDSPGTRIKKLLKSGTVRVNGKPVTLHSLPLKPGDEYEVIRQRYTIKKDELPFPVLYEDNEVTVIDKPAGIPTSSTDGSRSVQDILSASLRDRSKGKFRAHVVHRLDKEVSGVLLFAKTEKLMEAIRQNWKETEKHYYALVEGTPVKPEGTIRSWLVEDDRQKVHSVKENPDAKLAVTHYKTIRKAGPNTLLDIRTETGRKNQIRVHMSDLGCPIVGDRKYGASAEFIRRIRLHAWSLAFPHPVTGKNITVESPMPDGFLNLKSSDEKYKQR